MRLNNEPGDQWGVRTSAGIVVFSTQDKAEMYARAMEGKEVVTLDGRAVVETGLTVVHRYIPDWEDIWIREEEITGSRKKRPRRNDHGQRMIMDQETKDKIVTHAMSAWDALFSGHFAMYTESLNRLWNTINEYGLHEAGEHKPAVGNGDA